jgi:hypothetical protein
MPGEGVELIGGASVSSGRGWTMFCDGCGAPITAGGQYCAKCGKAIKPAGVAMGQTMGQGGVAAGARSAGDGRVRRNLRTVAILWMINGVLRLAETAWMMIFGTIFFPFMRNWGGGVWPFGGRWGPGFPFLGGLFSMGIFLALFGVVHLVLAWGLFERQPWARILGLVIGFLALVRFPLGTALGIYTLWALLPESSGREYDQMVAGGGQVGSAAVS